MSSRKGGDPASRPTADHLKSIFSKTGVRSRRELVATVLRQQYLLRAKAGQDPGEAGAAS